LSDAIAREVGASTAPITSPCSSHQLLQALPLSWRRSTVA